MNNEYNPSDEVDYCFFNLHEKLDQILSFDVLLSKSSLQHLQVV